MPSKFIYVITNGRISFFFNSWIIFIYIQLTYTTHLLYPFIHQRTRRCFHLSATANNSATNTGMQIPFQVFSFPLDKYSEVELLNHLVVLVLIFLTNLHAVFQSGCIRLHSHCQEDSLFSISSPIPVTSWFFFNNNHSKVCEVISHCAFDLQSPDSDVE